MHIVLSQLQKSESTGVAFSYPLQIVWLSGFFFVCLFKLLFYKLRSYIPVTFNF